jgi:hypothetical protein
MSILKGFACGRASLVCLIDSLAYQVPVQIADFVSGQSNTWVDISRTQVRGNITRLRMAAAFHLAKLWMSDWYFIADISDPTTFRAIWRAIPMMNRSQGKPVLVGVIYTFWGKV